MRAETVLVNVSVSIGDEEMSGEIETYRPLTERGKRLSDRWLVWALYRSIEEALDDPEEEITNGNG